jgi:ribonucleoside-diphosphate reductase beta chain
MRLYEKAKRFGIWNPSDIDFSTDRRHWLGFSEVERDVILRLTAMFQAGEEAVTLDLLPLIQAIASEGRIEEEIFLTTFLFEEAKHTDFFSRFFQEVVQTPANLTVYHSENYCRLIYTSLPGYLNALKADPSPAAQVRASVCYNLIVEGVLAETGYHAYFSMLERNNLLPGVRHGIRLLKQDESRHIAYGIYLLSRLVSEHPALWPTLEQTMNELVIPAVGVVAEVFACYDPVPFGLVEEDFVIFAMEQFQKRFARLEHARAATLDEVVQQTMQAIEQEDS